MKKLKKLVLVLIVLSIVASTLALVACTTEQPPTPKEPTKLSTPSDFYVNGGKLYWQAVANASAYLVEVTADEIQQQVSTATWDLPTTAKAYTIRVKAVGDGTDYTDSDWAEYVFKAKLSTPSDFYVNGGKLYWQAVANASAYLVEVTADEIQQQVSTATWDLPTTAKAYTIRVKAVGDGTYYTDSDWAEYVFELDTTVIVDANAFEYELIDDGNAYEVTKLKASFKEYATKIIIPSTYKQLPVTSIKYGAFQNNKLLTDVELPNGLKQINGNAFNGCKSLKNITLPNGLEIIGASAFSGCDAIERLILPESLTSIGEKAFSNCDNLADIGGRIPDGVEVLPNSWTSGCPKLSKELILPSSIKKIYYLAFDSDMTIYYEGTKEQWDLIDIVTLEEIHSKEYETYSKEEWEILYTLLNGAGVKNIENAKKYFYSQTQPTEEGNYWHYVNGEIVLWTKDN